MLDINQYDYYCPKCTKMLTEGEHVVFDIVKSSKVKAKLSLNPKPGSYDFICEPNLDFNKGELVDFSCPHCQQDLASDKFNKFIQIHLKVTDKVLFDVFFSRIHGVHKTYVGIEDFEEEYGEEIRKY